MSEPQEAAAHLIFGDATALDDPAVIIFPRMDGYPDADTRPIAEFGLPDGANLDDALARLRDVNGWRQVGTPTLVEFGYWIVDVESIEF